MGHHSLHFVDDLGQGRGVFSYQMLLPKDRNNLLTIKWGIVRKFAPAN
jgi:hypothetical protein